MAFPTLEATGTFSDTANGTTHAANYPAPAGGILANDILVCCVGMDAASSTMDVTYPGGWAEIVDGQFGSAMRGSAAWLRASGGESGTFTVTTSASEGGGIRVLCIRGAHTTTAPEGATATGSSTDPNPPSITASWGAADNFVIAMAMNDGNVAITAGPGGYSNFGNTRWANTAGAGVATATLTTTAATEDPGVFTMTAEQWAAGTIVIRPAAAAAEVIPDLVMAR